MKSVFGAGGMMLLAVLGIFDGAVFAQVTEAPPAENTQSIIASTDQSLFQAKGLPFGSFRLFPTLDFGVAYDDNVYRTSLATLNDYYYVINPALVLRSEWSRDSVELKASLDQYQYNRLDHETHTNYDVAADGRLDLSRGLSVDGITSFEILHLPRGDPNMPIQALEPTRYSDLHAGADVSQYLGPFGVRVGGLFDRYVYDPTQLIGGGTFDNSFQDRDEYSVFAKADYEFSPGYAVFTQATYDDRIYDLTPDSFGFNRNSNGIRVDAGLDMQVTNLIAGNIFAGYLSQNYKAPLRDLNGIDYGASLTWSPAGLLSVQLKAQHLIEETIVPGAAAANEQMVNLGLDYAFRHDIVLLAGAGYAVDNFSGAGRIDKIATGSAGVKYLMNEYVYFKTSYQYTDRTSTLTGFGYRDSTVMIGVGLQM
jgi:hypothetical protein